jgi:hypothetical protein
MTRTDAIAEINATLETLPDERLEMLAELAQSWTRPTVFSSLSDTEKAEIDAALDELDRGEGVAWGAVRAELDAKLKAAGV